MSHDASTIVRYIYTAGEKNNVKNHGNDHDFHLVDPSPWPILASFALLFMAGGAAFYFHDKPYSLYVMIAGFLAVTYVAYRWWKDCIAEGKDKPSHHTDIVQSGLRLGVLMFIVSEVMFFFAFFWSYFYGVIDPIDVLGDGNWAESEGVFPLAGVKTINPWSLPLFNTLLLLMSGTTVTWAHAALLRGNRKDLIRGLIATIVLGLIFTAVQALEYYHILHDYFKMADNNFSSNFFMATGFHGLHVIIGTIFLIVCLVRAIKNEMSEKHHLTFEFAAWYWHFVDVVWLFLFVSVYIGPLVF
jgi:cytochrome c oxidase subunit 3